MTDPGSSSLHAQRRRLFELCRVGAIVSGAFLLASVVLGFVMGQGPSDVIDRGWLAHLAATLVLAGSAQAARRMRGSSPRAIIALEIVSVIGSVFLFDVSAMIVGEPIVATFNTVLITGLVMILRAAIVPSSLLRTLFVSMGLAVMSFCCVALPLFTGFPTSYGTSAWSPAYHLIGSGLWLSAFTASSVLTGTIVYGLRQELHAARSIGPYVLHECLGEGGMGVVFRATHALLKRETAIKLVGSGREDGATIERFEREVVQTARLTHPNTVAIYDYGRTGDGAFYYAMEFLDGLNLEELVRIAGPLPPGRVTQLLAQVCGSLEEAHELGLVHRDIKPANIVVTCRSGSPDLIKVLDFGLVKDLDEVSTVSTMGQLIGTPATMSPEAIANPKLVGPATDLYALGAVGFFLLTGRPVFEGETVIAVCAHHLHDQPPTPSSIRPEVPAALDSIILSALAKKIEERPGSARALRTALLACPGVEPWTEADALAWWRDVGAPAMAERQARQSVPSLEQGRTLPIGAARPVPNRGARAAVVQDLRPRREAT
ncbi:MAG: serine/threonine protein kinase [Myxococcales bacterium]|nr:serine/threonine protein kinase [Myxococcales bacterium]